METISIESAQHLWVINNAITALANERLPWRLMRQVNKARRVISDVYQAFMQDIKPILDSYGGSIAPSDEKWEKFIQEAEDLWGEPQEISLQPIPVKDLEALESREDFGLRETDYEVLRVAGIIIE